MNTTSRDMAKRLKEAEVEQKVTKGDWWWSANGGYELHSTSVSRILGASVKLHTSDDLKQMIHAEGYECIGVDTYKITDPLMEYHAIVRCYPTTRNVKGMISAKGDTEANALAEAYLKILADKKPKTCGECKHFHNVFNIDGQWAASTCVGRWDVKESGRWRAAFKNEEACANFEEK